MDTDPDHPRFALATNIDVYFCDPQSSWRRGSNENTNGLLRQHFPKGIDLSMYSQTHCTKEHGWRRPPALRTEFNFGIEIVPTDGIALNRFFMDARAAFRIP